MPLAFTGCSNRCSVSAPASESGGRCGSYRNARIHLDTVDGLGCFVEIEVVVTEGMPQARALMRELRSALAISAKDLLAGSYSSISGERE